MSLNETRLNDVLTLLEGQGSIYRYADLVFLNPAFVSEVMKPLTNHYHTLVSLDPKEVTDSKLDALDVRSAMKTFINDQSSTELNQYAILEKLLKPILRSGKLDGNLDEHNMLLRFLWKDIKKLKPTDYAAIIKMLRESGISINSSFSSLEEGQPCWATKKYPIVLFRLPSERPNVEDMESVWPAKCPEKMNHFEVRIRLPLGCPPSLLPHL